MSSPTYSLRQFWKITSLTQPLYSCLYPMEKSISLSHNLWKLICKLLLYSGGSHGILTHPKKKKGILVTDLYRIRQQLLFKILIVSDSEKQKSLVKLEVLCTIYHQIHYYIVMSRRVHSSDESSYHVSRPGSQTVPWPPPHFALLY